MSDWKNVQYKDGKYRTSDEGGGGGSSTFAGLDDVSFNNLQNGQVPKYNSTTQKWENADESGGGGTVTDVQVDGISVVNPQGVAEIETPNAGGIEYDNQQSGLQATNMQDAVDELAQGSGGGGVEDVEVNGASVVNAQKVAEITSYKEVTIAEYQALPSSKLTDGIMYCIKDIGGANQFPPLIYSDEEREVGVWRDGKPLYEKTYSLNVILPASSGATQVSIPDLSSLNIDNVISCVGRAKGSSSNAGKMLTSDSARMWCYPDIVNKYIEVRQEQTSSANQFILFAVTLRYTKTTDTAGSGIWNQQGGYAHHYSATEKVVGTWIDGKPIYERVIDFTEFQGSTNRWITTPVNIPNGEYVVSCGFAQHPSLSSNFLYWVFCKFDSSGNLQAWFNGSTYYYARCKIQYTKTTD